MSSLHALAWTALGALLLAACSEAKAHDDTGEGGAATGGTAGASGSAHAGAPSPTEGGEAGAAGSDGTAFTEPRGACALTARVGRFSIEKQKDFGVVQGTVLNGTVPTAIPEQVAESGACQLLQRRNLSCSPACVGAETCGEQGSCIPYPRQVSVGTVAIAGLTKPTEMAPQMPGAVYFVRDADNPPFEPSHRVVLSAAGADGQSAFRLFGLGSQPLEQAPSWTLQRGRNLEVAWPAQAPGAATTVLVELSIDQHGVSPLTLACELEDTGQASLPSVILDKLIDSGVSGFPNGRIVRRTVDHEQLDVGCVELVVGSSLAATVRVEGFVPCMTQADCPDGKTCNLDLERCE